MKFKEGMQLAVFTRNHRKYLDEAAERNVADPVRPTAFRSGVRWVSARSANESVGPLRIYFAPIGGENKVEYQADLTHVHLDPKRGDTTADNILAWELDSTKGEGLWEKYGEKVRTLYVISRCERLETAFPATELVKTSDGKPISERYGYSYCLVYAHVPNPAADLEIHPEEVSDPTRYPEGATRTVSVNVYERSAAARSACIAQHGCSCTVCGFDFGAFYGELGAGFIHVHHLISLSKVDNDYTVDPVGDLRPVCPNCHAMLHRREPPLNVLELRERLVTKR